MNSMRNHENERKKRRNRCEWFVVLKFDWFIICYFHAKVAQPGTSSWSLQLMNALCVDDGRAAVWLDESPLQPRPSNWSMQRFHPHIVNAMWLGFKFDLISFGRTDPEFSLLTIEHIFGLFISNLLLWILNCSLFTNWLYKGNKTNTNWKEKLCKIQELFTVQMI